MIFKRLFLQSFIALLPGLVMAQTGIPFALPTHPVPVAISYAEYFWNTDPGLGNGAGIALAGLPSVTLTNTFPVSLSGLSTGVHELYFRVRDTDGTWSLATMKPFFIIDDAFTVPASQMSGNIIAAEYFADNDPGLGNGTAIAVVPGTDISVSNVGIDISALSNGTHTIYFRVKDNLGNWSLTSRKALSILNVQISIPEHKPADSIKLLEYFVDTDPGWGNGDTVVLPLGSVIANFSFPVNISNLSDGYHHVYVRTLGNRSLTNVKTFYKGLPLAIEGTSFTAALEGNDVQLHWTVARPHETAQFEIERSINGIKFDAIKTTVVDADSNNFHAVDLNTVALNVEKLHYRLKIRQTDGTFTYTPIVTLQLPDASGSITISTAPNPFTNEIVLNTFAVSDELLHVRCLNATGSIVQERNVTITKGFCRTKLDTEGFPSGTYLLQVSGKTGNKTIKLVKSNR